MTQGEEKKQDLWRERFSAYRSSPDIRYLNCTSWGEWPGPVEVRTLMVCFWYCSVLKLCIGRYCINNVLSNGDSKRNGTKYYCDKSIRVTQGEKKKQDLWRERFSAYRSSPDIRYLNCTSWGEWPGPVEVRTLMVCFWYCSVLKLCIGRYCINNVLSNVGQ